MIGGGEGSERKGIVQRNIMNRSGDFICIVISAKLDAFALYNFQYNVI